jgi:hypothetical protein
MAVFNLYLGNIVFLSFDINNGKDKIIMFGPLVEGLDKYDRDSEFNLQLYYIVN